jgi:hypothetical protein
MDTMLEIGTFEIGNDMFTELKNHGTHSFSRKSNWRKVEKIEDLLTSHGEGGLVLISSSETNWEQR